MIKQKNLIDMLGRQGNLVNIGDYYLFQPIEIRNKFVTNYQRKVPVDFKK